MLQVVIQLLLAVVAQAAHPLEIVRQAMEPTAATQYFLLLRPLAVAVGADLITATALLAAPAVAAHTPPVLVQPLQQAKDLPAATAQGILSEAAVEAVLESLALLEPQVEMAAMGFLLQ